MTATLLTYARHAQNGRINPSRVVPEVAYTGEPVDPADALAKFADGKDIAATLAEFNPQNPHYKALKAKLVELRGGKNGAAADPRSQRARAEARQVRRARCARTRPAREARHRGQGQRRL